MQESTATNDCTHLFHLLMARKGFSDEVRWASTHPSRRAILRMRLAELETEITAAEAAFKPWGLGVTLASFKAHPSTVL